LPGSHHLLHNLLKKQTVVRMRLNLRHFSLIQDVNQMSRHSEISQEPGSRHQGRDGDYSIAGESMTAGASSEIAQEYARAAKLASLEIGYIDNPDFAAPEVREDFLAEFGDPSDT